MRKSYLLALVAAALFLVLIGTGFWDVPQGDEESPPPKATTVEVTIPPMLGGLPLVEAITGNEGVAQVSLTHGKDVRLMRGYIAQYADSEARTTLWVGWAESEAAAQALSDRMTAKIGSDHPTFQDPQVLTLGGRTVYATTGQGQLGEDFCPDLLKPLSVC
jgi:hypothetical protein